MSSNDVVDVGLLCILSTRVCSIKKGSRIKSISILRKLVKLTNSIDPYQYVGFLQKLSDTYSHIGEFESAIKANEKILDLIEETYGDRFDFNIVGGNDGDLNYWAIEHLNAINKKRSCLISIIHGETIEKNALKKLSQEINQINTFSMKILASQMKKMDIGIMKINLVG